MEPTFSLVCHQRKEFMAENITIPTTDLSAIEEKVKKWYLANKDKYNEFKKQADGIGKMDFTFFMNLMKFVSDCIPKDKLDVCSYIFRLGYGDNPSYDETPDYIKQYDDVMEDFLQGGKVITINIGNSEVKCFAPNEDYTPENNVCVISNDDYERLQAEQPELLRCYLDDLYEQLDGEGLFAEGEGGIRSSEMFFELVRKMAHIYALILVPEILRNMLTMNAHTHNDFPYCLYYYCAFDGGMRQMMSMTSSVFSQPKGGMMGYVAKKMITQMFVKKSIELGYEKKNTWEDTVKSESEETAGFIRQALSMIKGIGGKRKAKYQTVDDLLVGNKEELKRAIKTFRLHQRDTVSLGYLFYLLGGRPTEKTRSFNDQEDIDKRFRFVYKIHIKPCTFKTFCTAVLEFTGEKQINDLKRVRERYLMCKCSEDGLADNAEDHEDYRTVAWRNARKVTGKWLPVFNEID